jgi:flagellar biosynthetic protein FliR
MTIDYPTLIKIISQIIWPIGRFTGLFLVTPFFSSIFIPTRIKVVFILALSWVCSSMVPDELTLEHFNGVYLVYMIQDIALGVLMGFIFQFVFEIFVLVGQIISMQTGLAFAVMVDPQSNASVPIISQFYNLMVMLIFLALNGHVALLDALMTSFKVIPIGSVHLGEGVVWGVINFSGWMFKEAVLITIPVIISLLIVSLSFGIITRVSPQLNSYSLAFPISLLMGVALMQISLPGVAYQMIKNLEEGMHFIVGLVR